MQWQEVKQVYPEQWLVIEALNAHTDVDSHRYLDDVVVIEPCSDAKGAMQQYPERELYFVHTSCAELDIVERQWLGIRKNNAITAD